MSLTFRFATRSLGQVSLTKAIRPTNSLSAHCFILRSQLVCPAASPLGPLCRPCPPSTTRMDARLLAGAVMALAAMWANVSSCEEAAALRVTAPDVAIISPPRFASLRALLRLVQILVLFLPALLTFPLSLIHRRSYDLWFSLLIASIETAGPTFIKLGQWASTRPDILPRSLCARLSCLHNNVRPLSAATSRRALEQSLGKSVEQLFVSFDDVPVGSGCIAQVHRAILRETNEHVAVKIRRPGVEQQVWVDLYLMARIAQCLHALPSLRPLHIPEVVQYFGHFMRNQLDFTREARNLDRFHINFKDNKSVVFPRPVAHYLHEDVLLESFERGDSLSEYLLHNQHKQQQQQHHQRQQQQHQQQQNQQPQQHHQQQHEQIQQQTHQARQLHHQQAVDPVMEKIANTAIDMFLKMVFVDNFVHGDLHPGNILVNRSTTQPSIVVIDAGLVTELTPGDRKNFVDLVVAVANGDGNRAAEIMVERSIYENKIHDFPAFQAGMERIVGQVRTTSFQLSKVQIGEVLSNVMSLVRKHRVHMDPVFANMVISIGVLEGVGRQLSPNTDLFQRILPLLPFAQEEYLLGALKLVVDDRGNATHKPKRVVM